MCANLFLRLMSKCANNVQIKGKYCGLLLATLSLSMGNSKVVDNYFIFAMQVLVLNENT